MKNLIKYSLMLFLLFGLTSCWNNNDDKNDDEESESKENHINKRELDLNDFT